MHCTRDARSIEDIQAAVKFASKHCLRQVAQNTGHTTILLCNTKLRESVPRPGVFLSIKFTSPESAKTAVTEFTWTNPPLQMRAGRVRLLFFDKFKFLNRFERGRRNKTTFFVGSTIRQYTGSSRTSSGQSIPNCPLHPSRAQVLVDKPTYSTLDCRQR